MPRLVLLLALLAAPSLAPPVLAEDPPSAKPADVPVFAVLRIKAGDDTTFKVFPAKETETQKIRIVNETKQALKAWEEKKAAFLADKGNRGMLFLEPKPEVASCSVIASLPTEEEAKARAEEEQRKADGKYAVARVTGTDGIALVEVLPKKKLPEREKELKEQYTKEKQEYNAESKAWYADPRYVEPRKQAQLAGQPDPYPFTKTPPKKPLLERLKDGSKESWDTREEANKFAETARKGG